MSLLTESYWVAGLVSLSGAILILLCYRAFFHPLAGFPGPRLASVTGLWQLWHIVIGDWHVIIHGLHQKYGKVVRLAPNELSIVDESAMRALYGHGATAVKGNWYRAFQPAQAEPNALATQDREIHAKIRRRLAPAFKMTAVLRLEDSMQGCLDKIMQQLDELASRGAMIDMCYWTNALAWDVIGQLCYGEPLGPPNGADGINIRDILSDLLVVSAILGHVWGQLAWVENPLTRFLGVKNPVAQFFEWSSVKVHQHEQDDRSGIAQQDLVDHFLAYVDPQGKPATHLDAVDGAFSTIGAGADTVAIAMRSALYYLSINTAILEKLHKEIDTLDISDAITYKQTQQLPYLKAVVRESLRMFPSIPAQLYRYVPEGGLSVDNHLVPAGTVVGMSSLAQNRDAAIYGSDADVFNPDRWLGDETRARYLEASLFNFGGTGPRACVGRNLALMELYKFVAQMVQKFEFELVNKKHPFSAQTYFLVRQSDMKMKIAHREKHVRFRGS